MRLLPISLIGIGGGLLCLQVARLPDAFVVGCMALAASVAAVFIQTKRRHRTSIAPVSVFLLAAAIHVVIGYIVAGPASFATSISGSVGRFYDKSFLIMVLFLAAAATGYIIFSHSPMTRYSRWWDSFELKESRLIALFKLLLVSGSLIVFGVYYHLGYAPILSDDPGRDRFAWAAVGMSTETIVSNWLINRAVDMLTCALPFLVVYTWQTKKLRHMALVAIGMLAMLTPLRRQNIVAALLAALLIFGRQGKNWKSMSLAAIILFLLYGASQFVFAPVYYVGGGDSIAPVVGSAVTEVRDLGWMLSLFNGQWLWGASIVQPFVPLPSFMTETWERYSLASISRRAIGLRAEDPGGGLRIPLAGESYFNFGYAGPIIIGFVFGIACAYIAVGLAKARAEQSWISSYLAAMAFVWVCYFLYLSGTGAAATVKVGTVIVVALVVASRKKRGRVTRAHKQIWSLQDAQRVGNCRSVR